VVASDLKSQHRDPSQLFLHTHLLLKPLLEPLPRAALRATRPGRGLKSGLERAPFLGWQSLCKGRSNIYQGRILYEKAFKLKLSGDEVYYTACSLQVILNNSSSE